MSSMTLYFEEIDPDDDTPVEVPDGDWQPTPDDAGDANVDLGDMTGFVTSATAPGAANATGYCWEQSSSHPHARQRGDGLIGGVGV